MTRTGRKRVVGSVIVTWDGGFHFKVGDWGEDAFCLVDNVPQGLYRLILEPIKPKRRKK